MWLGAADILAYQKTLEAVFFSAMQNPDPKGLVARVAAEISIDTESIVLAWNDLIGTMREWLGDRVLTNLKGESITLTPRHYERTVQLNKDHFNDDKLSLCSEQMNGMAKIVLSHYKKIVAEKLLAGFTDLGWDGKAIFAADHPYVDALTGVAGTVDNLSAANVGAAGLEEAVAYFDNLVAPDGSPLDVEPDTLIVAPGQRSDAEELILRQYDATGANNLWYQRFNLIVEKSFTNKYWMLLCTTGPTKPIRLVKRQLAQIAWSGMDSSVLQMRNDIIAGVDARHDAIWTTYQLAFGSTGT
jgi:phage major head subunit gpT-like protein